MLLLQSHTMETYYTCTLCGGGYSTQGNTRNSITHIDGEIIRSVDQLLGIRIDVNQFLCRFCDRTIRGFDHFRILCLNRKEENEIEHGEIVNEIFAIAEEKTYVENKSDYVGINSGSEISDDDDFPANVKQSINDCDDLRKPIDYFDKNIQLDLEAECINNHQVFKSDKIYTEKEESLYNTEYLLEKDLVAPHQLMPGKVDEISVELNDIKTKDLSIMQDEPECVICNINLSKTRFISHMRRIHGKEVLRGLQEKYKCVDCEERFSSKYKLQRHQVDLHSIGIEYTKVKSSFSLASIEKLLKRKLTLEEVDNFNSLISGGKDKDIFCTIFKSDVLFDKKEVRKKKSERYTRNWLCKQCPNDEFYGSNEAFNKHFKTHEPKFKAVYLCELCDSKSKRKTNYVDHLSSFHFRDKECDICDQIFSLKTLSQHKRSVHGVERIKCEKCDQICSSKGGLKNHDDYHHSTEEFVCPICSKIMTGKARFEGHLKTHGDIIQCDQCEYKTHENCNLVLHARRMHTSVFDHFCDICGIGFKTTAAVKGHIKRRHRKKAKAKCEECSKEFADANYLRIHKKRMHEAGHKKLFPCDLCDYQADRGYSIKKHKRVVHEMSMETCFMCSKQVKSLYHHFRHFHKDQPELWEKYNMELKSDNDGWKRKQLFEKIIN